MRKINRRNFLKAAGILSAAVAGSLMTGCGGSDAGTQAAASNLTPYNELTVGTDHTDLTATIKVINHRTDLIQDGTFDGYVAEFQTTTIPLTELGDYFYPMCDLTAIQEDYNFAANRAFDGKVYGIPSTGNAQGVIYNKRVFEAAGVTSIPKTPTEFLDALQKVRDYDPSIDPLYTNYAAGWTMSAWDAYIGGGATGDPDWMGIVMPQTMDPFSPGVPTGDPESGPYAVYNILYEAVKRSLTEADPTTTDWEGSKTRMNNGEIAVMVLGSWAIVQVQDAGPNAADIGYMPFPITVNGTQYASAGSDYCYGINLYSSDDNKLAAMLYIKWLTESSNFAYDQGGVPVLKSQEYPETLAAFDGIELLEDTTAPDELADLAVNVQLSACRTTSTSLPGTIFSMP